MLSVEDIYREIGKNIYIYPLDIGKFRDNSIDLTASRFAWTNDGKYIFDEKTNRITVPKHSTACILTREAIYVSQKIGGTCHSRVSLVQKGFGHIGTMIDPKYCGQLLIMLHNTSDFDLSLEEGERLVSLVFYYLSTPIHEPVLPTPSSHSEKVSKLDRDDIYKEWCEENQWANNAEKLKGVFVEKCSKDFEEKKKIYAQNKSFFERIWASNKGRMAFKYTLITIILLTTIYIVARFFPPTDKANWAGIFLPIIMCLVGMIVGDISKK